MRSRVCCLSALASACVPLCTVHAATVASNAGHREFAERGTVPISRYVLGGGNSRGVTAHSSTQRNGDSPRASSSSADGYRALAEVLRAAAAKVSPSVVTIETVGGTQPGGGGATTGPAAPGGFILADGPTTGLVYSSDGLILTSTFNFLRNPTVITVVLADGRRLVGELLARDEVCKLAMLKVNVRDLPVPTWRMEGEPPVVGESAIALGRGFGGPRCSMNVGIVSGLNRMSGLAIQTDAHLSPANFGGPLIDLEGRVLGICVPMGLADAPIAGVEWYDSGIGFAIPRRKVRESADDLAIGHNLRRGLIGVQLDSRSRGAVRVISVADPSPALRAGMLAGDEIIAVAGQGIRDYAELRRVIRARRAGEWIDVRIRRNHQEMTLRVILAVPEDIGPMQPVPETQPGVPESAPP